VELGIDVGALSEDKKQALEKSIASLLEVNEHERNVALASFDIQQRGQRLPGDIGNNFGLLGDLSGFNGNFSPLNGFPSSRFAPSAYDYGILPLSSSLAINQGVQGSFAYFSRNTRLAHVKMALCVSAYKGFGVAKNVIDLMANFAAEGLKIKHPSKTVERFYQRWAELVGLQGRIKDMLRYYYKYGNVFIYTTPGVIDQGAYDTMRRARAVDFKSLDFVRGNTNDPILEDRIKKVKKEQTKLVSEREIPWRYTLLNPFQMELRGSKFFGSSRWVFVLDEQTTTSLKSGLIQYKSPYVDFLDESDINLPPEFAKLARELSVEALPGETNDPRVVDLEQTRLWTMHYMKDDHEDWADPLLWPVMADIYYKNKLRQMDISVCNSVINAVTVFKIGNLKEGYIPPKEHFSKFAEFLRTPTQAMNMVWNDALSIENSFPPVDKILGMAKYESVDRDILRGIGVPDVLLGGGDGANFSTGFLGVRTLLERLEEGRDTIIEWLNSQLRSIAAVMGHRRLPKVSFGRMSLRDEKAEKQLILALLDRNVISVEAVLDAFGEDFEIELERMRDEEKIRDTEGLLVPHGPFPDPMNLFAPTETSMVQQQGINGRPPGTEGIPQKKKRETKPRGMAKALKHIRQTREIVQEVLGDNDEYTRQGINEITYVAASYIPYGKVNLNNIQAVLRKHTTIHDDLIPLVEKSGYSSKEEVMAYAIATHRGVGYAGRP